MEKAQHDTGKSLAFKEHNKQNLSDYFLQLLNNKMTAISFNQGWSNIKTQNLFFVLEVPDEENKYCILRGHRFCSL
jgi:hypothetical protein